MSKHKTILKGFLIIIGLILLLYQPVINHIIGPVILEKKQSNNLSEQNIHDNKVAQENKKHSKEEWNELFNYDNIKPIETLSIKPKFDTKRVVGGIYAPDVNMLMPIMIGVTEDVLVTAAGTMKPNQEMGEGNYALISHNSRNPNALFAPIHRLNKGNIIYITDKKNVYKYKVNVTDIIQPSDIQVIDDKETPMITLLTCTNDSKNRVLIQGELTDIISYNDVEEEIRKHFDKL